MANPLALEAREFEGSSPSILIYYNTHVYGAEVYSVPPNDVNPSAKSSFWK